MNQAIPTPVCGSENNETGPLRDAGHMGFRLGSDRAQSWSPEEWVKQRGFRISTPEVIKQIRDRACASSWQ
jgi:hypothetical protein